jgi:uncharacterized protein with HEPN domain
MSKRNEQLLIADILESVAKIKKYTAGLSFEIFLQDSKTCDAVIRNFEIIGEAANRLPDDFKEKHSSINWFRIVGFRNRIVHDYMGVDYQIVWTIVQNDIDKLTSGLQQILNK